MAVDTSIRFNSRNTYKVTTQVFCYPFGVQGQTHVTHSFQAYATSSLSSATRAKTKFFDADGVLVSESSHAFAVTPVFGIVEITVAIPATAIQAQLMFLQGGTDWWFAEPKSEYGKSPTPYTVSYTNQLTYITPTGIYTGMITTGQIVVTGSVASPDETLDTRLVTINNGVINLTATSNNHGTRITSIEAGQASFVKFDDLGTPNGTYINGGNIKTGKIQSVDGQSYFDLVAGKLKSVDVDLTGYINATSGKIGGMTVSGNDLVINTSKTFGPFSQADLDHVMDIVMRYITPTASDYDKYDFYGNGRLSSVTLNTIIQMINGTYGWTNPDTINYTMTISSSGTNNFITFSNDKNTEKTVIRTSSIEVPSIKCQTLEATVDINAHSVSANMLSASSAASGTFIAKNSSGQDVSIYVNEGIVQSITVI